jgi:hypothetical protein
MNDEKMSLKMRTELLGYSERGLINSLFYELNYKDPDGKLLSQLLDKVYFPDWKGSFKVSEVTILIEQSFSDFGDADVVLLIKNGVRNQTVFIEAKVKTSGKGGWKIADEFAEFRAGSEPKKLSSSNLFTQLYHKHRLVDGIAEMGVDYVASKGLPFPACSTKSPRKLGKNKIVRRAANMIAANIIKEYHDDVFFIGILPDQKKNIEEFVDKELRPFIPKKDPNWHWSIKNWGWLSWQTVKNFCEANDLKITLGNFEHNEEQIFK